MWELLLEAGEFLFSKETAELALHGASEFASAGGHYSVGSCNVNSNIDYHNVNNNQNYQNFKDKKNIKNVHNNQNISYNYNNYPVKYSNQKPIVNKKSNKSVSKERPAKNAKQQHYNIPAGSVAFVFPQPMSIKIGNQTIQLKAGGKLIVPPGSKVILPPNYVIAPTKNVQRQKSDSRNHKPQPTKSQDNKAKLLGNKVKKQFNLNKHTSAAEPNKNKKNPTAPPINKKLINSQKGVNQK